MDGIGPVGKERYMRLRKKACKNLDSKLESLAV